MVLGSLESLPPEIISKVFSFADTPTLAKARHLSHYLEPFAAEWLFQEIDLRTNGTDLECQRFINIAQSTKLNRHVRSVVCTADVTESLPFYPNVDGNNEDNFRTMDKVSLEIVVGAVHILPFLAHFRNLTTLELFFFEHPMLRFDEPDPGISVDVIDFRSGVIETILESLAGTWSPERQTKIDKTLELITEGKYRASRRVAPETGLIRLKSLSIWDFNTRLHPRVAKSKAYEAVVGSGNIVDFSLINTTTTTRNIRAGPFYFKKELEFFEQMPRVWFIAPMAENLQTLQLDFPDDWGWHPKVNLETITPALPSLRELTLSSFVFSHERQAQWIASLGKQNVSGGLEVLMLFGCKILYRAQYLGQLDYRESGAGYPTLENMSRLIDEGETDFGLFFHLRWYAVLDRLRESMPALTSFQLNDFSDEDDATTRRNRKRGRGFLDYADFHHMCWPLYDFTPNKRVPLAGGQDPDYHTERDPERPDVGRCQAKDEEAAELLFSAVRSRKLSLEEGRNKT
ncbi:hypothetical protein G7Z17_g1918 [Cylindrodendrum hubeiense]|uniref:F-box domain-containing protein n=1 Tax=Cylindrodendrum hubeiense TaxID=595255 RepID=A0A9P5HKU4_9HYPO|nr:hypothetical protein G7Z17_g1918 [Cylindrodendrum hubeiense]